MADRRVKHGLRNHPIYYIWRGMLSRCYNKANKNYHNYGARGIRVCRRWKRSVAAFFADVGDRPSPYHFLDRIDNNRGYYPKNCRWVTTTESRRNIRNVRWFTHNHRRLCLSDWAVEFRVYPSSLSRLIAKHGVDRAFALAEAGKNRKIRRVVKITHRGRTLSIGEWARCLGIDRKSLLWRIEKWGAGRAIDTMATGGRNESVR